MNDKKVAILGSTGSIGTQSLDVIRKLDYHVTALAANRNVGLLETQVREFRPEVVCVVCEDAAEDLKTRIADIQTRVVTGTEGLCECACLESTDVVLNSVVGMVGLKPTLAAVRAGKDIALANKETLVAGGKLVTDAVKNNGVSIYPVDSEHSAIFQALQGCPNKQALKKLILTASGGPFFGKTRRELENVKPEQALKHPNWSMGRKITIDSATMVNKGLELIEAAWLFDVSPEQIEILVHRESIVHSMIMYRDNSVIAQLGVPDMRIPIQYALTYPQRVESPVEELDLMQVGKLTFFEPDNETFKGIELCKNALLSGGLCTAAANGANEQAVELFLDGKIKFFDIYSLIQGAAECAPKKDEYSVQDVLDADAAAREYVLSTVGR